MKERPILFSSSMVRAILDGSKTQTRRIVKFQRGDDCFVMMDYDGVGWWPYSSDDGESADVDGMEYPYKSPYGQPGDRLWVRETWAIVSKATDLAKIYYAASKQQSHTEFHEYFPVALAEGLQPTWPKYRPSIHMPRWASRILLEVTNVRVERLQDISEADAVAEGAPCFDICDLPDSFFGRDDLPLQDAKNPHRNGYARLWEEINGEGSWDANPWVWVVEFRRIDQLKAAA